MSRNRLKASIEAQGGFKHWFVNVFWFHYKWPVLAGVLVLGIVGFITWDSLRQTRYDATVVIATDYFVDETELDALDEVLKPAVGDLDGNGQVNIAYATLYVDENNEVGRQNEERMYLYMTQEDVSLYLMSGEVSAAYTDPRLDFFTDELSQYELDSDPANPVRLSLRGNQLLEGCGMNDIYLSIMDFTTVSGSREAEQSRDSAIAMARAIIDAG